MNLPRGPQIRKAFKALIREIDLSLKEVNRRAAKMMQRGHYAGAQQAMTEAQNLQAYLLEAKALQKRQGSVRHGSSGIGKTPKDQQHALWEYYQPILAALVSLGGEAKRPAIEVKFQELSDGWLLPGDRESMGRGKPRWKVMIARAKKPMLAEGFVEAPNIMKWRITDNGRAAANKRLDQVRKS
jgi:hypothetical protein